MNPWGGRPGPPELPAGRFGVEVKGFGSLWSSMGHWSILKAPKAVLGLAFYVSFVTYFPPKNYSLATSAFSAH